LGSREFVDCIIHGWMLYCEEEEYEFTFRKEGVVPNIFTFGSANSGCPCLEQKEHGVSAFPKAVSRPSFPKRLGTLEGDTAAGVTEVAIDQPCNACAKPGLQDQISRH
jgi:hypothetical protein